MMNPDDSQEQALWDAKCAAAPRCDCCGKSVYPHDTYAELGNFVFCEPCWGAADICHTDNLEL